MPTLKATFILNDKLSGTAARLIGTTNRTEKALGAASKKADGLNASLRQTGGAASVAHSGIMKLVGAVASFAAIQKGMQLADTYMTTRARLDMITESLEEQKALQQDIYAAAQRARMGYDETANAVAKLVMLAPDTFANNREAVNFNEILGKSLKISGTSSSEKAAVMTQLTQSLTSGVLQGDEFRSIRENAPIIIDAISRYTGKSKAELKELSSEGYITSDIIKASMFAMSDEIENRFAKMPATFADTWEQMKNYAVRAFGEVYEKANNLLNSDLGQSAVRTFGTVIGFTAGVLSRFLDLVRFLGENMDILGPIILGVAAAWMVYNAASGIAWLSTLTAAGAAVVHGLASAFETAQIIALIAAQDGFNAALAACPITWILVAIIAVIAALFAAAAAVAKFTGAAQTGFGIIMGVVFAAAAYIANEFIGAANYVIGVFIELYNMVANIAAGFGILFNNPVAAIEVVILSMFNFIVGIAKAAAGVLDAVFGSNLAGAVEGFQGSVQAKIDTTIAENGGTKANTKNAADYQFNRINYGDAFKSGTKFGDGVANKVGSLFGGSGFDLGTGGLPDYSGFGGSDYGSAGNPATVKGTGAGGAVKVENKEDIEWLRKLAERDYIARIAQNTLAPNIKVEFTGPVTKEADTDQVASHLTELLKESIATAPEGLPA